MRAPDDRLRDDLSAVAQRAKAEAIQTCFVALDCFASLAMTEEKAMPHIPAVIPRESGVSSTRWLIGSITAASGILDHPLSRMMTTEYGFAVSQ
jgi:hypothetical protein